MKNVPGDRENSMLWERKRRITGGKSLSRQKEMKSNAQVEKFAFVQSSSKVKGGGRMWAS